MSTEETEAKRDEQDASLAPAEPAAPAPGPEREADDVDGPPDEEAADLQPESEPAPAPPADPALSEKEIEKKIGQLERAAVAYRKKVADLLGEEIGLYFETPLTDGQVFGFVLNPQLAPIPEEVVNLTKSLIGEPVPPPLLPDTHSQECPDCQGWGIVLTGSKVHGKNTAACKGCGGRGSVGDRYNVDPSQFVPGAQVPAETNGHEADALLPEDPWGTPIGHPDYGKMPNFREPGWQAALTAYRGGEPAPVG
jgi:hypothetical protein